MSGRRALDTSNLINQWKRRSGRDSVDEASPSDVARWAMELIELHQTRAICTPVRVEFLCNTHGNVTLKKAREYLDCFEVIDNGVITPEDWRQAERFAPHRATDVKSNRQLGDCLIAAIYKRLNYSLVPTSQVDKDLYRRVHSSKKDAT